MKILIAPDSFKGTLTASEVCDIIGQAFRNRINDSEIMKLPAADGGEGLCACFREIMGGETVKTEVCGVFGEKITAEYLVLEDNTAVIEMATCAGLPLAGENKNPEKATTFGVGELINHAVKNNAKKILLGLGAVRPMIAVSVWHRHSVGFSQMKTERNLFPRVKPCTNSVK